AALPGGGLRAAPLWSRRESAPGLAARRLLTIRRRSLLVQTSSLRSAESVSFPRVATVRRRKPSRVAVLPTCAAHDRPLGTGFSHPRLVSRPLEKHDPCRDAPAHE